MQVLKKICVFFLGVLLAACDTFLPTENQINIRGGSYDIGRRLPENTETGPDFKVAMLLPLSGRTAVYGRGLKNAAMMAIEDADNPGLQIRFYDTAGTSEGARLAAQEAISAGNSLILGPLTSNEVAAVSEPARRNRVPVISFSTSPSVLQEGVYTLGLMSREQIERIISYAAGKGRKRLAVLVPDNPAGMNMAAVANAQAARFGMEVVKIGFYPPETLDFTDLVKDISDYQKRSQEVSRQKSKLQQLAHGGDKDAARRLKKLKSTYTTGTIDFDCVLIPESKNRLKSAAAMFGYYDISYPDVLFLGTSVWENGNLNKETTLYHGVYPVISRIHNDYFNRKYQSLFGESPNQLYSFAYDGVALASALARKNLQNMTESITDRDGYIGINGAFRIFADGSNQHSLDVVEVTPEGPKVVDAAVKKFEAYPINLPVAGAGVSLPKIYGKDPLAVHNLLQQNQDTETDFFSYW